MVAVLVAAAGASAVRHIKIRPTFIAEGGTLPTLEAASGDGAVAVTGGDIPGSGDSPRIPGSGAGAVAGTGDTRRTSGVAEAEAAVDTGVAAEAVSEDLSHTFTRPCWRTRGRASSGSGAARVSAPSAIAKATERRQRSNSRTA